MKIFLIFLFLIGPHQVYSQDVVPTVVIEEAETPFHPINHHHTFKSEKVSHDKMQEPTRQTVADLVKDQVGVDTQTYCANCGAKRLTINGLKGEHTSILVDGLPLHSAVSSFYGVDSIPVNGISDIEVMRGAGASLTNPEAIGGAINLMTVNPLEAKQIYSTSISVNDELWGTQQNHSTLTTITSEKKTFGVSFGAQYTEQESWDEDKNNVAESPQRDNISGLLKFRYLPNSKNDFMVRFGASDLTILGGPTHATKPNQVRPIPALESDFINGSVEEKYIGDPFKITDWVNLTRQETAFHWTHFLTEQTTYNFNAGYARQTQDAIYQHGFDYANIDNMFVADTNLQSQFGSHLLKFGLFYKDQKLRSASTELYVNRTNIPADSFNYSGSAAYMQDTWFLADGIELDLALRAEKISMNWLELSNEINEWVLAPRFQYRQDFTDHLAQRFSYGLGYRAPLTFFESQHGNEENGYIIDITEIEKAHSFVYSLSYNKPTYYVTGGVHYTHLENMAYGFEFQGNPIFYRSTDEEYDLYTTDLLAGLKITPWWMLETSVEFFTYPDGYTRKLPTAAIERRYQLKSTIEKGAWKHIFLTNFIGSRDLSRYASYNEYYVDRNQFPPPETIGDELKNQKAPAFVTFDTSLTYNFNTIYFATFGVNNLFDYTQTGVGDSPSAWHWHFDHGHFDGLHTWGPNRGREYYLKFMAQF